VRLTVDSVECARRGDGHNADRAITANTISGQGGTNGGASVVTIQLRLRRLSAVHLASAAVVMVPPLGLVQDNHSPASVEVRIGLQELIQLCGAWKWQHQAARYG
jgi:hypothetical protein